MRNNVQHLKCGGIVGFFEVLRTLLVQVRPSKVVVAWNGIWDGKDKYSFYAPWEIEKQKVWERRERLFANDGMTFLTEKEENELEIIRQTVKVKRLLENCSIRQAEEENTEAFDLIAGYAAKARMEGEHVHIFSREQEFYQLIDEDVCCITPTFEIIDHLNFQDKTGYHKDNALMMNSFVGGNGIATGVPFITTKKIIKFFPGVRNFRYFYAQILEEMEKRKKKVKFFDKIREARPTLKRNAMVLDTSKPFLNKNSQNELRQMLWAPLSVDRSIGEVMKYFRVDGYEKHLSLPLEEFFGPFFSIIVNEREYKRKYQMITI